MRKAEGGSSQWVPNLLEADLWPVSGGVVDAGQKQGAILRYLGADRRSLRGTPDKSRCTFLTQGNGCTISPVSCGRNLTKI